MNNEYRKALIRNPNIFLLENKKLKQAKNKNKANIQTGPTDDDFWKDCMDINYMYISIN
jgi:hypothetical protein